MAVQALRDQKKIRGLKTIATQRGFDVTQLQLLKKSPSQRLLKPEYINYLCKDYGISADWLILGKGSMFAKT